MDYGMMWNDDTHEKVHDINSYLYTYYQEYYIIADTPSPTLADTATMPTLSLLCHAQL